MTTAVAWSSTDPSVGTVTATGLATALAEGRAFVAAAMGSLRGQAVLQVSDGQPLPIDPRLIAPPLDRTSGTPLFKATAFIYGEGAIQSGVAPGTIEPRRVSVIRGFVRTPADLPLPGVSITVVGHPEFGSTLTRLDGAFDLVVNGGTLVTVHYAKDGYLPADRPVDAPWQDYVRAPDVAMVSVDPRVTAVDLNSAVAFQVARGSTSTDADGTRTATLFVPQGTSATLMLPDGSTQSLARMNVRATEYTVGGQGPLAMPAPLPSMSGFTYAAEFSIDEALAVGAKDVRFTQPLITYVDNFLGFPVGGPVPVGYYDRERRVWVPSKNGRIIKLLFESAGLAALDVDGNGTPASEAALAALGVTPAERQKLAELYEPGQSLWRIPIAHFTPWDANWPMGPPRDATGPGADAGPEETDEDLDENDCRGGSIIECQNGTLGGRIPIVGTPFTLNYRSSRVPGRRSAKTLNIRLTGSSLSPGLKRVDLEIFVAGRWFTDTFPAAPNQQTSFVWDGRDAYERPVQGSVPTYVRIGYVYDGVYRQPGQGDQSFGAAGGQEISGSRTRQEITIWQGYQTALGTWDVTSQGGGGWSLSVQHMYDTWAGTLYLGDGRRRSASNVASTTIKTVAGGGLQTGSSGKATDLRLFGPSGLRAGADGSLFVSDTGTYGATNPIYRIAPDGTYGRLANDVGVAAVVAPDGSLYTADNRYNHNHVNRIAPDGAVTLVAGAGPAGFSGDGGPATLARLNNPVGLALAPDGTLYIAEGSSYRIRRVGTDGIITTCAGTGEFGYSGDGGPAIAAKIKDPYGIAVGPDGSVYVADLDNGRIRRVGPDGIMTTVAGRGVRGYDGDGGPAVNAALDGPTDVAVGRDGSLYITDFYRQRVRRVGTDGVITTVAGNGVSGFSGDQGPAAGANLKYPSQITVAPDGSVFAADRGNYRIRQLGAALPQRAVGTLVIPSDDGSEVYYFDDTGRHLRTVNAATGATIHTFEYSSFGHLVAIVDGDGNRTSIERSGGTPTAIVAPGGQRTALALNGGGHLSQVRDPGGNVTTVDYSSDGLLTDLTDARQNSHHFAYDEDGRLVRDEDPAGGSLSVSRTVDESRSTTSITTAEGRTTTYAVEPLPTGDLRLVNTEPTGLQTTTLRRADGTWSVALPDSSVLQLKQTGDPRFAMQAPITSSVSFTTPGGVNSTMTTGRTISLSEPGNPLSLVWIEDSFKPSQTAGTYKSRFTVSTRQVVVTTPAGRQSVSMLDAQGRVTEWRPGNLTPVQFVYDAKGRLTDIAQGSRRSIIAYDAQHRPTRLTDALSRDVRFEYDAAGRITTQHLPDGREIHFSYDGSGNITALSPPGRPEHQFSSTPVDLTEGYTPPAVPGTGPTRYEYNRDRDLAAVVRPDGARTTFVYDGGGRVASVSFAGGSLNYTYRPNGQIATIATHGGVDLTYNLDGPLPVSERWVGVFNGTVTRSFNDRLFVENERVNDEAPISFGYDSDGLITQAGILSITRNQVGLPTSTRLGAVTDATTYDGFAESTRYTARAATGSGPLELYDVRYQRDANGRIMQRIEVIDGVLRVFAYFYDQAGRLSAMTRNGELEVHYTYDSNGNRLIAEGVRGTFAATYDSQDRLLTYGGTSYTYTANGELLTRTVGDQITSYEYDALGNLRRVRVPSGTDIQYLVDGRNRRVAKLVNGVRVRAWIYGDQLRPIAELEGSGAVVARFVYGTRANAPDYMVKGGDTYRIIADHLGSPRVVINTITGEIAQRLDYDPFGIVTYDSNPAFQPFGFAGGLHDPDTRLVRFGARDYDAETGRWTAKDPLWFGGGDTSLYSYALGDATNLIDPDGRLVPLLAAGAAVGAAVGVVVYAATADNYSWQGFLGAAVGGAIAGGFGTVAAPIAASLGLGTGAAGTAAVNAGIGLASGLASAGLDPCQDVTASHLASTAAFGALGGYAGNKLFPTKGMSVFGQKGFPRTWQGVIPTALGGTAGPNATNAIYQGGAVSVGAGAAGPVYVK